MVDRMVLNWASYVVESIVGHDFLKDVHVIPVLRNCKQVQCINDEIGYPATSSEMEGLR